MQLRVVVGKCSVLGPSVQYLGTAHECGIRCNVGTNVGIQETFQEAPAWKRVLKLTLETDPYM